MALAAGTGFVLETPTWRANPDWAEKVGYGRDALGRINRAAIDLMAEIRARYETPASPMVISGCIGPRGDGYDPGTLMAADEAEAYHAFQIGIFRETSADFVSAFTMTNSNEARGFAQAAKAADMPCVISFTVETDGRLPTGESLGGRDRSCRCGDGKVAGLLHDQLRPPHAFRSRPRRRQLLGEAFARPSRQFITLQPCRARRLSGARRGRSRSAGREYAAILRRFPHINVLGGCCGTDHRHVECISRAFHPVAA